MNGVIVRAAVERAMMAMIAARDALNAADARLGDGDTGTMLARAAEAVLDDLAAKAPNEPSAVFRVASDAMARDTGSSLGTLLALGLRRCAKKLGELKAVTPAELADALEEAAAQMRKAGGAKPGDKTVVDFVDGITPHIRRNYGELQVSQAARTLLEEYRPRPCLVGRARLYPERSQGADDPGMLAAALATAAICGLTIDQQVN